ncbi:MAG: hypothetical protein ABI766_07280 [Gemmatimonadales bacterium]
MTSFVFGSRTAAGTSGDDTVPPGDGATIAVSITHGFQARNLLQTDVAPALLDAGYQLSVLSPAADDADFQRTFGLPGMTFRPVAASIGRATAFFGTARRYALANPRRNATNNLFNEQFLRSRRPHYVFLRALNRVVGRWRSVRDLWMSLESTMVSGRELEPVLQANRPALLVTGTPGTEHLDALLLRCARRLGIPSLCVVLSWDNLTSKGYMAARPDRLVVWNERMRQEAIELHDYAPEDVEVAGVAHFDIYQRPTELLDRSTVCRRLGLDPGRPYVVFGTVSPFLYPHNHDLAEMLAEATAEGKIGRHTQLVVRLHPQAVGGGRFGDTCAAYENLEERYPGTVVLDVPKVTTSGLQWALPSDEMTWLASLLRHAGVCVNVASTLAIDAALTETPVVGVGFDGRERPAYERSIRRAYDYTHYRPIVESGGAPVAETFEALLAQINAYLADPSRDAAGRRRIAEEQAWRLDGQAGRRVAAAIARYARGHA